MRTEWLVLLPLPFFDSKILVFQFIYKDMIMFFENIIIIIINQNLHQVQSLKSQCHEHALEPLEQCVFIECTWCTFFIFRNDFMNSYKTSSFFLLSSLKRRGFGILLFSPWITWDMKFHFCQATNWWIFLVLNRCKAR